MRRFLMVLMSLLASVLIAGCGGSGHAVDPPASGLNLVAGDGVITASWIMEPSVEYWVFVAPNSNLTTTNWDKLVGSKVIMNAPSPTVISQLANGTTYYVTMNGRTSSGPGGAGTPLVSATPRLAGTAPAPWIAGKALGANDLRGVARGATAFVSVGAGGVMYSSADGASGTWTAIAPLVVTDLNAAAYSGISLTYAAVGNGGVILSSSDAATWTARVSGSARNLYGVAAGATVGGGRMVAVGAGGTILLSADGGNTWTPAASSGTVTANDLYAVTYHSGGLFIAVGDGGAILTSSDANTWTKAASNTAANLKGVAWGKNATTTATVFLAVGASGTLLTSPDAVTWTAQPKIGTGATTLLGVTYGSQFIAVGTGGSIFTSTDGTTWASQTSTVATNLNAIVFGPYWYSVVGAAGTNLLAK